MRVLVVALCLVAVAVATQPAVYESAEAARKAAEEELNALGDAAEPVSAETTAKAEKEALSLAKEAAADPLHSDLEGVKVDLGEVSDPVAPASAAPAVGAPAAVPAPPAVPAAAPKDTHNEQLASQDGESDVPVVKHVKHAKAPAPAAAAPASEELPDGFGHLLEEGTRPGAPQMFPQFPGMMLGAPGFPQASPLQAPDVDGSAQLPAAPLGQFPMANGMPDFNQMFKQLPQLMGQLPKMDSMPQMPQGFPAMPQMPQMPQGFPAMPQMPQMPQGFPAMPQMPQMPQGFPAMPQMPQMPQGFPAMPQMPQDMSQGFPAMPQMPQMPQGFPAMPQMPQMPQGMSQGFPSMPQMPQGFPGMPQMPQMPQGFPQMPGMMPQMANMFPSLEQQPQHGHKHHKKNHH